MGYEILLVLITKPISKSAIDHTLGLKGFDGLLGDAYQILLLLREVNGKTKGGVTVAAAELHKEPGLKDRGLDRRRGGGHHANS